MNTAHHSTDLNRWTTRCVSGFELLLLYRIQRLFPIIGKKLLWVIILSDPDILAIQIVPSTKDAFFQSLVEPLGPARSTRNISFWILSGAPYPGASTKNSSFWFLVMPFRPDIATKIKKCLFLSVAFTGKLSTKIPNNDFPVEHQAENAPLELQKNTSWWNTCQQLHQHSERKLPGGTGTPANTCQQLHQNGPKKLPVGAR